MEKPELHGDASTAIEHISHGKGLLILLRSLLLQDRHQPNKKYTESLLDESLKSLDMALLHLKSCESEMETSESSKEQSRSTARAVAVGPKPKQKLGDKCKKKQHSRTIMTSSPFGDGHQWRKYGQKNILNAEHPRSYYRCTYSEDKNCSATKQVQQKDGDQDLPEYMVKYNGKHTCGTRNTPSESNVSNIKDLDRQSSLSTASVQPEVLQQVEMDKEVEELLAMIIKSDNFLSNATDQSVTSSCSLGVDGLHDEFFAYNDDGFDCVLSSL
ncbi:hypothetical protein HPP92_022584 [Vanilla planifolia]|uniref:WRKY domain-containing protein n=1 Tax=Vanilla planifolia TaxID=51239 RepID=A0A835PSF7_VANPL|nr:hypothetical protein HPP92_022584 [Vanilla planifolia]